MSDMNDLKEFSKPFVDAAKNIFQTMVSCELRAKESNIKTANNMSSGDISAVMGLTGELERDSRQIPYKATLVFSFPYQTYFNIAGAMLFETYTTYHPDIHDLGGELANMVMGNAKRDLKSLGFSSNMAIPSMVEGKGHTIKYPAGTTVMLIPLETEHGPLFMELCFSLAE